MVAKAIRFVYFLGLVFSQTYRVTDRVDIRAGAIVYTSNVSRGRKAEKDQGFQEAEHGARNGSRKTEMTNSSAAKTVQRRQHIPTATSWSRPQDSSVEPEATSTSSLAEVGNASVEPTRVCCKCRKTDATELYKWCPNKGGLLGGKGKRFVSCNVENCGLKSEPGWSCGIGAFGRHLADEENCKVNIVAISDPGQDLDDEMSFIMMKGLSQQGLINVVGVLTTMQPPDKRAALARGTLNLLGLKHVHVGIGSDGGATGTNKFEEGASPYCNMNNPTNINTDGQQMLLDIYTNARPKSITLLIIASLRDVATFMRGNLDLFSKKTYEVVIMGGAVLPDAEGDLITPDDAHNQHFDEQASKQVFKQCQDHKVPLIIVSRYAVYAVPFPPEVYTELAAYSPIGTRLFTAQKTSIEALWKQANLPLDSKERKLPSTRTRKWFVDFFLGGIDPPGNGPIFELVKSFFQYDSMALLAAVPELRTELFEPLIVKVKGIEHKVIGVNEKTTNIKPQGKEELTRRLSKEYVEIVKQLQTEKESWLAELLLQRKGEERFNR